MSIDQATHQINRLMTQRVADFEAPSLRVLPYPGGRHPRRGFLDGAIDPQRETKISVFPPWENGGYVVVDVPEAIFSNLGLTYLAHTHVPTIWTEQGIELEPIEWDAHDDGLRFERRLPNGIVFGSRASSDSDSVSMEMWLTNGTDQPLSGMRSQVCVMLEDAGRISTVDGDDSTSSTDRSWPSRRISTNRWLITSWRPIVEPGPIHGSPASIPIQFFPIALRERRFRYRANCGSTKVRTSRASCSGSSSRRAP